MWLTRLHAGRARVRPVAVRLERVRRVVQRLGARGAGRQQRPATSRANKRARTKPGEAERKRRSIVASTAPDRARPSTGRICKRRPVGVPSWSRTCGIGIDVGGHQDRRPRCSATTDARSRGVRVATPTEYRGVAGGRRRARRTGSGRSAPERAITVGVGTPGFLQPGSGLIRNSNLLCLNDRPLDRDLAPAPWAARCGSPTTPSASSSPRRPTARRRRPPGARPRRARTSCSARRWGPAWAAGSSSTAAC